MSIVNRYINWVDKHKNVVNKYPRSITEPIYIVDKDEE